jgi:hypothetical protein
LIFRDSCAHRCLSVIVWQIFHFSKWLWHLSLSVTIWSKGWKLSETTRGFGNLSTPPGTKPGGPRCFSFYHRPEITNIRADGTKSLVQNKIRSPRKMRCRLPPFARICSVSKRNCKFFTQEKDTSRPESTCESSLSVLVTLSKRGANPNKPTKKTIQSLLFLLDQNSLADQIFNITYPHIQSYA